MLHANTKIYRKKDTKILHIRVLISNDNGKVNTKYVNKCTTGNNEFDSMREYVYRFRFEFGDSVNARNVHA